ncbi:hypothetical protein ACA29_07385 [Lederbergia galactosidilytica]|uniref:Ricin B lectin domain-containing protein n=1 Tax=Lederbergia galactosidilytica TaxID=217031 RepID=A0A0Q9Y8L3_9BACI|nr:hypothetical protein ACA29_07385 [Lederbergia galactosidilytica]
MFRKTLFSTIVFLGFLMLFSVSALANFDEGKSYVFINKNSGKVLDVYDWSSDDDVPLVQWDRNDLEVQQWKISGTDDWLLSNPKFLQ